MRAGGFGVERKLKLLVPVEEETRVAESVVAIASAGAVAGDVGGVRGDFVGDHALLHVFRVGQAEMFFGRDVAKHGRAVPADHGRADGAGDVVVAGGDIGDERAERVERRFVAQLDFFFHLQFDLVHRNVAGAFDHHLHIVFPGFFGQFAQDFQFGELRFVAGVGEAAGAQAIAERKADVVLLEDLADVVEIFVEEILLLCGSSSTAP